MFLLYHYFVKLIIHSYLFTETHLLTHSHIKAFFLALSLLTRLPTPNLPELQPEDTGRSALFYPLTGLIIGMFLCLPVFVFPNASPLLIAAVITVIWAAITGGLHLDGLADSADGWLGGLGDPSKTQQIMKDPLVGAAGVIAIACVLLLKFAALTTLLLQGNWIIVLLAPLLGKSMIILLFLTTLTAPTTKNAHANSMASSVIDFIPKKVAAVVVGICYLVLVSKGRILVK